MPLDFPNTVANSPQTRLRAVKAAVGASYCRAMANNVAGNIELYGDLDLRPLVSTAVVPIPMKPAGVPTSLPGIPSTGDPSLDFQPAPNILYGF